MEDVPKPTPPFPALQTDLPKASIRDAGLKNQVLPPAARCPCRNQQPPRTRYKWCPLWERQETQVEVTSGFQWWPRAWGCHPLIRIGTDRRETTKRTQGRQKQHLAGVASMAQHIGRPSRTSVNWSLHLWKMRISFKRVCSWTAF